MNHEELREQISLLDNQHASRLLELAKQYKTTPLMVVYGLIDKQYRLTHGKYNTLTGEYEI